MRYHTSLLTITFLLLLTPIKPSHADIKINSLILSTDYITIDGNQSDWDSINAPKFPLIHYRSNTGSWTHPGKTDLDASFSLLVDTANMYILITVRDDIAITTKQIFGWGWSDDSVEICFDGDRINPGKPYFDANDGQLIVSRSPKGDVYLEGVAPYLYIAQIPGFWEARGVRAALAPTDEGYVVEVAIPREVLGWRADDHDHEIGLNIRVFDDDTGGANRIDGYLTWAEDAANTCFWKTGAYTPVTFIGSDNASAPKVPPISDNKSPDNRAVTTIPPAGISPNDVEHLNAAVTAMADDNWKDALTKLSGMNDSHLKLMVEGVLRLHAGQAEEGVGCLLRAETRAPSAIIADWCREYPAAFAKEMLISGELAERYGTLSGGRALMACCFRLFHDPDDKQAVDMLLQGLERSSDNEDELVEIYRILMHFPRHEIQSAALLSLARYHFSTNQHKTAALLCRILLSKKPDAEIALQAETILVAVNN